MSPLSMRTFFFGLQNFLAYVSIAALPIYISFFFLIDYIWKKCLRLRRDSFFVFLLNFLHSSEYWCFSWGLWFLHQESRYPCKIFRYFVFPEEDLHWWDQQDYWQILFGLWKTMPVIKQWVADYVELLAFVFSMILF